MNDQPAILVTGATGTTGSRVAALLTAGESAVTVASRDPAGRPGARAARFDWHDSGTFDDALRQADRLYLVPPPRDSSPATVMLPFLERASAAGIRRVVLLSAAIIPSGGPGAGVVHAALPDMFDEWAVLRPAWFMQNFIGVHPHARGIRDHGVIMTATGSGRVGFIDADDIAEVAVRALTAEAAPNSDLVITGPEALSYDDIAATISQVTGAPVTHRHLTEQQLRDRLAIIMPADFAAQLAAGDRAIAEGTQEFLTTTVERVTGHPARGFRAFVENNRAGLPGHTADAGDARSDDRDPAGTHRRSGMG